MHIKICGNVRPDDSARVADLGPDYMGWILSPASPRRVGLSAALAQIELVRKRNPHVKHLAVMARNPWGEAVSVMRRGAAHFDFYQWVEPPLRSRTLPVSIVPGIRVRGHLEAHALRRFGPTPFFVLDSYVPGQPGGTGHRFDPAHVAAVDFPFLLAGGLTPDNVAEAWAQCPRAFGVDVSSGLESAPGRKDGAKLARFFKVARNLAPHAGAPMPNCGPSIPPQRSKRGLGARKGGRTIASISSM